MRLQSQVDVRPRPSMATFLRDDKFYMTLVNLRRVLLYLNSPNRDLILRFATFR